MPTHHSPPAIAKVFIMSAGRVAGYAKYIERDGAARKDIPESPTAVQGYSAYIGRDGSGSDGTRPVLFTRDHEQVDQEAFIARSHGDPRAWALVVSPGRNDLDMERYIRELMHQMELDLHKQLDWIAAIHRNTPHTHAHVLLRGKDREGREFRMRREYISAGLRHRATELRTLATSMGWRHHPQALDHHASFHSSVATVQHALERWFHQHSRDGLGRESSEKTRR